MPLAPHRAVRAHPADVQDALGRHRPFPFAAGAHGGVPADRPAAGVDPHRAGGGAAPLRRPPRDATSTCASWPTGRPTARAATRSRSSSRAWCCRTSPACRCCATSPRCAPRRRTRSKNPKTIEPLVPVDLVVDHCVHDRRLRAQELARHQHEDRVPAQQRALQVHEVGHAGVRHLRRGAAGLRHRPPGQPRVPGARRAQAGRRGRRAAVLPRHPGRHRQPHHHDQRPGRGRLGRGRHRGGSRHAGPAGVLPDARRRRLRAHRPAARGRHRHRPGADRHRDAAQGQGGGQVRRVLRRRHGAAVGARPRHASPTWRPSTAPPWASSRSTTRRSTTCAAPAAPTPEIEAFEAYFRAQGLFGMPASGIHRLQRVARARPVHRGAQPGRPEAPAGPHRDRQAVKASSTSCSSSRRRKTATTMPPDQVDARCAVTRQRHRARPRRRADRGHHLLHQHLQPERDAGRRPAGQEGRGGRPERPAAHQDLAGPRLAHRHRIPGPRPACCLTSRSSAST